MRARLQSLPAILGWGNVQKHATFVPFLTLLHLGTAAALGVFYRDRWARVIGAFVTSATRGRLSHTPDEHLAWMLFFGTIPAGVLGAVLEHTIKGRDHGLHQRALPDPLLPHGAAGPLCLLLHRGWSGLVSLYSDARRVGKRQSAGHGTVT